MAELDKATIAISKDIVAGGIITAFAVGFGALAWGYPFGAPTQMGPGFFPLLLAGLLACLGLGVTVQGLLVPAEPMALVSPLRLVCVLATPLIFGVLVRPLGFLPAVLIAAFVGTLAARGMSFATRLSVSAALAVLTTAVFVWGLGVPLQPLGRWLTI